MERHDPGDLENISAYAKLEFDQFSFFIQTLTLIVGRKARREDNVDVHLGVSKSISRVHAKIFYQFDAMTWEIEVLGKNGAFINERYVQAGKKSALRSTDKLLIGDAHFVFLLPDGATAPLDPSQANHAATNKQVTNVPATPRPFVPSKVTPLPRNVTNGIIPATPLAPHHLMANPLAAQSKVVTNTIPAPIRNSTGTIATTDAQTNPGTSVVRAYLTTPQNQADYSSTTTISQHKIVRPDASTQGIGTGLREDKLSSNIKMENVHTKADPFWSHKIPTNSVEQSVVSDQEKIESLEVQAKTEEERRLQEEEAAAQHAAQLLHQERLARQAREEEEGLILPPAETDPAVIAALQKPSASYATMIYNAIASHEKKKMTLAQIYSWICINHPYYRYVQNGWQNSIRHNLSLNKAFMKVPRTDDEPGKGSFWAVDPESEMLFEGGVYKKKPPRPMPSVPLSRGAPVVMKDGKLALNPNFFLGGIQGKAEEVLQMLQAAVQKQLGYGNEPEQASQIARILALALATQLRQAAVANNASRHQQVQVLNRPVSVPMPPSLPRYPATPAPSAYRAPVVQSLPRPLQANGTLGLSASGTSPSTVRLPINSTLANTVPKHPYVGSPYAINGNSTVSAIAGSKVPQPNSTSSPGQLSLHSVASGVSHVAVKPITNPVYYKPYSVANASAPNIKPGVANTTAAKLTPGIAQNYNTVQPNRADQFVKSMPSVDTTLTKIHPVRSSVVPIKDSSALSVGEKSATVLQSPVIYQCSTIPKTLTQSSIQAGQPEVAGASARSSVTTSATGQVVTPYACTQPANQSLTIPTAATKPVEGLPAGVGVRSPLIHSTDITKEVPVNASSVSKPSIPATINLEHTDSGTSSKVMKDQSGARPGEFRPDSNESIVRVDPPSTVVAKDDSVRVQIDPATKMDSVSVFRPTPGSMVAASPSNAAPSITAATSAASVNNKRSVPADAETSANKLQKADSKIPADGDVKQVAKVDS